MSAQRAGGQLPRGVCRGERRGREGRDRTERQTDPTQS